MADVFISYAREDVAHAERLAGTLTAAGCSVWWDPHIRFGEMYVEVIERELEAAACVVVLWSRHSVKARWVREEATLGLEREKLVPIRIDDSPIPFGFGMVHSAALKGAISDDCIAAIKEAAARFPMKKRRSRLITTAAIVLAVIVVAFAWMLLTGGGEKIVTPPVAPTHTAGTETSASQTSGTDTATGTTITDDDPRTPNPKAVLVDEHLDAIRQHKQKLEAISVSTEYYGPRDDGRLKKEIEAWKGKDQAMVRDRDRCLAMKQRAATDACLNRILAAYTAPEPLPPPGKIIPVRRESGNPAVINFSESDPHQLLKNNETYTKPLTILVKGQWAGHFTDSQNRCVDIIAYTLSFQSGSRRFTLHHPEGRAIAESITGAPLPAAQGNAYVMQRWPAGRPLSVTYSDSRGYINHAVCPSDRPYVVLWQNDSRINTKDPYMAVQDVTP